MRFRLGYVARIVLENDDKSYSALDVLEIYNGLKIPMIVDIHHHNCVNNGEHLEDLLPLIKVKEEIKVKGKEDKQGKKGPRVAPGFNDEKFGEDAAPEEIKKGLSTKVTRVFLDENDPS